MTKKISYIIGIILIITGCSVYESVYQDTPLNIDGSSSDWTTTLDSKDNNSFSYGISNDNENLYIRININDQSIQKKLILAGLTVWVDTTGRKNETFGITCPIKKAPPKIDRNFKQRTQSTPNWSNNQLLEIEFIGLKDQVEIYYLYDNPYSVEVSIDQDEFKSLYYEMKIPFKSIYSDYSDISLKTLSIGLETGALEMPSPGSGPVGMSGRPGGMSGGGKGGGRSGGMPGGGKGVGRSIGMPNNSSVTNMTTPTKVWIKNIKLAQQ